MRRKNCDGWVPTLEGKTLAFTGKVFVDGVWKNRGDCESLAQARGVSNCCPRFTKQVNLLVHGDLAGQSVPVSDQRERLDRSS